MSDLKPTYWILSRISLGLIKGILFVVAGYLFLIPTPNKFRNYGDGSFYYIISSILPFETYIHVGLFTLACMSVYKGTNLLSFAMAKMGTLYIGIHTMGQLIVSLYYADYYVRQYRQNIEINASHKVHYNAIHDYIRDPMILIPVFINLVLFIASFVAFFMIDHVRNANIHQIIHCKSLQNNYYKGTEIKDCKQSQNTISNESYETDNECVGLLNRETHATTDEFGFFENNSSLNDTQKYFCKILYILLCTEWIWYIIYVILTTFHHCQLHINDLLSFADWTYGYTKSFTMAFHRAFICSVIYKLLYHNKCRNTLSISIAMAMNLVPTVLNLGYLLKLTAICFGIFDDLRFDNWSIISFCLLITEFLIDIGFGYCFYNLINDKQNIKQHKYDVVNTNTMKWYPRPTIWDMANINEHFLDNNTTRKMVIGNKIWAKCIAISVLGLCLIELFIENFITISINTFYSSSVHFEWEWFNKILLWGLHLSAMYFYGFILSVRIADDFKLNKPISTLLGVAMLLISLLPLYHILSFQSHNNYKWMTYLSLIFCFFRMMFSLMFIVGLNMYSPISKDEYIAYKNKEQLCINYNKMKHEKDRAYWILCAFIITLSLYVYCNIFWDEWNCNLISLNMEYNINDKVVVNWSIFGGETPLFGAAFHIGFLVGLFIFDTAISKHWSPSYDLSMSFLITVIVLGSWQLFNFIIYYIYAYSTDQMFRKDISWAVTLFFVVFLYIAYKAFGLVYNVDNIFPHKSGFFMWE